MRERWNKNFNGVIIYFDKVQFESGPLVKILNRADDEVHQRKTRNNEPDINHRAPLYKLGFRQTMNTLKL